MRDEFGREIPGRSGGGYTSHNNHSHHSNNHHPHNIHHYQQHEYAALSLNQPLSSSRYSTTAPAVTMGDGGGPHPSIRPNHSSPSRYTNHYNNNNNNSNDSSPMMIMNSALSSQPSTSSSLLPNTTTVKKQHPSLRYTSDPLLCEFRYQEERKKQQEAEQQQQMEPNDAATLSHLHETAESKRDAYIEYRQQYCLTYIRSFFNTHMDAPWFRYMYSPYHIYFTLQQSRYTKYTPVVELTQLKSLLQHASSLLSRQPEEDEHQEEGTTNVASPFQEFMDEHVRLWERRCSTAPSTSFLETPRAHLFAFQRAATGDPNDSATTTSTLSTIGGNDTGSRTAPVVSESERLSALHITEIPTHMSDTHIMNAFKDIVKFLYSPTTTTAAPTAPVTDNTEPTATSAPVPPTSASTTPPQLQIWPSQQMVLQKGNIYHYARDVIVTGPSDAILSILQFLKSHTKVPNPNDPVPPPSSDRTDIPRKQVHPQPPSIQVSVPTTTGIGTTTGRPDMSHMTTTTAYRMDVECTDLYGRKPAEVNHPEQQAKLEQTLKEETGAVTTTTTTAATATSNAAKDTNNPPLEEDKIKTYPVMVSLLPTHNSQNYNRNNNIASTLSKNVTVRLSAALSSTERIEYDTYAAYQIAMALDDLYNIPSGLRIHDLLSDASISDDRLWTYEASDKLDFIIAYLRRVHLFSYYNGCCFVNHSLCDVATGKNAVSTIHVRMKNADTFLQELQKDQEASMVDTATTAEAPVRRKDLLVQRLDDAIAKALHEYCGITEPGDTYISANRDNYQMTMAAERQAQLVQDANAIQDAQDAVQQQWLSEYGIKAPDGRARCSSFPNCCKLFKDTTFLCKHLLKKHSEHLLAEQAKCHDAFLMKAWENLSVRPVPDILVDCGELFGTVVCPVVGTIPTCTDPEPELWRLEVERRQRLEEMEARRLESRKKYKQQQQQQQQSSSDHHGPPEAPSQRPPPARVNNFVDVDDMKVEKVEVSFDNVIAPDVVATIATTNKKKKRKLL